jgi:MFS family permease
VASSRETRVVYGAGVVQGVVLVTFPAASTILTDPDRYDLSSTQYGLLFVPQVVTAIAASLLGATLGRRFGTKRVYLAGLAAGLVSMALLVVSTLFEGDAGAFALLLVATAFLGVGFGLTVPALNTLTAAFHPGRVASSVLVLNALLGLGTALAPVFVAIFDGLGFWWGLPVLSAALLALLLVASAGLPLRTGDEDAGLETAPAAARGIPARFWAYAAFAVLYGVCETVNGNWSQLDMTSEVGASTTAAAVALTAFWSMVTVGRVVFAAADPCVRPGGAGLLGAPAADDRLRAGGAHRHLRRGCGRRDRLLPARVRARGVRRRAARGRRHGAVDRLRVGRARRARFGCALVRRGPPPGAGVAPSPSGAGRLSPSRARLASIHPMWMIGLRAERVSVAPWPTHPGAPTCS